MASNTNNLNYVLIANTALSGNALPRLGFCVLSAALAVIGPLDGGVRDRAGDEGDEDGGGAALRVPQEHRDGGAEVDVPAEHGR